ncbi:MAG: MFS transporter [Pseudomonadota bacterium]
MSFRVSMVIFLGASLLQSMVYGLTFLLPDLFHSVGGTVGDVGSALLTVGIVTILTAVTLGRLTKRYGHFRILVLSCVACAAALILLGTVPRIGVVTYLASVFLGFGWAGFYILGPIVLAGVLAPNDRVKYFSWLAAFIMAGIGAGPILGYAVVNMGWPIAWAFHIVAGFSLACAIAFFCLQAQFVAAGSGNTTPQDALTLGSAIQVLRSKAWRPVVMVTLGASVFASAFNFQTIYAEENYLDYPLFFLVYTVTVIVGRFVVAAFMLKLPPYLLIAGFLSCMTFGILALIPSDPSILRYIACAFLLGIGYGLAYPIVKSMAANDALPGLQDATLQLFGLGYFVGIFAFPFGAAALFQSFGMAALLWCAAALAAMETTLALNRYLSDRSAHHRVRREGLR